ncbi:MAG: DUF4139 domain-containing protein [Calditrichaeota bacterium]|nr:DUF4139 domain-containing protein [Candidatus Cloacimonadota bacterium]MCA9785690.1 DUF4139 domain-containing protein [Candidatus Cloacimonadota bacterium]MCB1046673.1 DUF4139 domain-containing protein [Calditrichota bacterium]
MDHRRTLSGVAAMLVAATGSHADSANITVYSNGFGLVSETRQMVFEKGVQVVPFDGVSQYIEPSSVLFDGSGLALLEQNYVYDLVNGDALLKRFLDKEISVSLKEGGEQVSGRLLSYSGDIVLQTATGIISLSRGGLQAIRYPELPEGLRTRPALNWTIDARKAGPQDVTVTYTTGGMSWQAEYVCLLNQDDTSMELAAWVNLSNTTGMSWQDAGLQLVAGDLNQARPEVMVNYSALKMADAGERARGFEEESFFEYHLYTLPRPVTLENNQDKEITLFPTTETKVTKEYVYSSRQGGGVKTLLRFVNKKGEGPGMPIPAGKVRMYKKDSAGRKQLIGEDRVDHTPVDEDIELTTGEAFDLVVERVVKDNRSFGRGYETDIEFTVRNHKKDGRVTIFLDEYAWGDWDIVKCSHKAVKKDANRARIPVELDAGGEATVTLTMRGRR